MATSVQISKPPPPSKSARSTPAPPSSKPSSSSSLSSHLAMVELKSRILASLAKLADRDTHQIAADDLEKIISTLPADGVPMMLNSLTTDPPGAAPPTTVRRESLRLLTLLASTHPDAAAAHLPKIITYFVRRLKDPAADSSVRDACREATAALTTLYVKPCVEEASGGGGGYAVLGLFLKPLLEAMGEQNKVVQAGAAACLAKVVECTGVGSGAGGAFHKLCLRVCKLLDSQNFQAKGSLLAVISSLSQVGEISPQTMLPLLQCVRECLESIDWFTRKAAADTLSALATHSSHLIGDGSASTIAALESCRFDKVKPVRDSMIAALSLWKKLAGKEEVGGAEDTKKCESTEAEEQSDNRKSNPSSRRPESKDASGSSSPTGSDLNSIGRGGGIPEKTAVFLKKKVPSLTDKDLNPEFFQKLETRNPDDLPIEVVLPRGVLKSSDLQCEEEQELADKDSRGASDHVGYADGHPNEGVNENKLIANDRVLEPESAQDSWMGQRGFRTRDPKTRSLDSKGQSEVNLNDASSANANMSRADGSTPIDNSFINSKSNWLAIQRQLAQLERQQANIMSMLQNFMGGSHQSMITLENRVRGLERVMVEMARDLAVSSGRKDGGLMMSFEGSPGRPSGMFGGFHDYTSSMFGRAIDSRVPYPERFLSNDNSGSGLRSKESSWRSDCEAWDSYPHTPPRNGTVTSRRGQNIGNFESRLPRNEPDNGSVGNRRAWDKGQGPFRLDEGPSARSVWQASKDEATLEAIRVAGEDNGTSQATTQVSSRELDTEALADDNVGQERRPHWDLWTRAMDSLQIGDMDSAYADVLSMDNEILLVKLMERSGPVISQLSKEIAREVLHVAGQFLLEQSLFDIALSWMQQFMELTTKSGVDFLHIPFETKKEILLNLQDVSSLEVPEDWEGASPEQMMLQLASIWGVNLQQIFK